MMELVQWGMGVDVRTVLVGLILAMGCWYWTSRKCRQDGVPWARGLPIVGSIMDFTPKTLLHTLRTYPAMYGKAVRFRILHRKGILLNDAALIREVFQKRPKRFRRMRADEYLSNLLHMSSGLFNSNGDTWNRIRRATAPSFSSLNIKLKFPAILEQVESLISRLGRHAVTGNTVDMKFEAFSFTIRVITVVAFGLPVDNFDATKYFVSMEFMQDIFSFFRLGAAHRLFPGPMWLWRFSPQYRYEAEGIAANNRMTDAAQRIIQLKRELFTQSESAPAPSAMIDFMIIKEANHTSDALTDEEIIANIKTFFIAGAETTSVVISWLMYLLATRPDIRDKIRAEADVLLEKPVAQLTVDDFVHIPYCKAVERELLRLLSPAIAAPYDLTDLSTSVRVGANAATGEEGIELFPGEAVWVNVEGAMRDASVYAPDPLVFRPERWLRTAPDSSEEQEKFAQMETHFLSFGGGPRVCPGMHLASSEIVLAMVFVAKYLDVSLSCPEAEIERIMNFTACANKMPVKFHLRPQP